MIWNVHNPGQQKQDFHKRFAYPKDLYFVADLEIVIQYPDFSTIQTQKPKL